MVFYHDDYLPIKCEMYRESTSEEVSESAESVDS